MLPDLYFDANGSTPLHPRVLETCQGLLADFYGNPSAAHAEGQRARRVIDAARATIARALGAAPEEILFTSGGTESNNWALFGAAASSPRASSLGADTSSTSCRSMPPAACAAATSKRACGPTRCSRR